MLPVLLQMLAEHLPVFDTKYRFLTKILPVFGSGGLAGMQKKNLIWGIREHLVGY